MFKTKSFYSIFAILFFAIFSSFFLMACNEEKDEIASIYIKDGTYVTAIEKDATYDTTNIEVYAKYVKKADTKLANEDVTFSAIDTSTVGTKTLTASTKVGEKTITSSAVNVTVYGALQGIDLKADSFKASVFDDEIDDYDTSTVAAVATYEGDYTTDIATSQLSVVFDKTNIQTEQDTGKNFINLSATYNGKTATAKIYVYQNTITNLSVKNLPAELRVNDLVDFSAVIVTGLRTDGETIVLTKDKDDVDGYTVSAFSTTTAGEKEITFVYAKDENITKTLAIKVFGAVTAVVIDETTAKTTVNVNQTYSTKDIKLNVTFEGFELDGVTPLEKTLFGSNEEVSFSNIDTSVANVDQVLTATFENVLSTNSVTIHVVRGIIMSALEQDENYDNYITNSQNQNTFVATGSEGTKGFLQVGNPYLVGTDNAYFYNPVAVGIDTTTGEIVETTYFVANITVEEEVEGEQEFSFVDVTDDETLVTFDTYTHAFYFKEDAQGKSFRITISSGSFSAASAVKVVEGFNIHSKAELSVFDNVNAGGKWTEFKTANNLLNVNANTLILHTNITLEDSDFPEGHFWKASERADLAGKLKNWDIGYGSNAVDAFASTDNGQRYGIIYRRAVAENETFTFEGNYFKIDISNVSIMVNEGTDPIPQDEEEPILSLTSLFGCEAMLQRIPDPSAPQDTTKGLDTTAVCNINNTEFFGNSNKSATSTSNVGGLMAFKNRNINSHFYNNFSQSFYMAYMIRGMDENVDMGEESTLPLTTTFNKITAFDSYNVLLYFQGNGRTEIRDSVLIGAGGPVMICDHAKSKEEYAMDESKGRTTYIYEINSILESYVTGQEAWFQSFGKEDGSPLSLAQILAATVKSMDPLYTSAFTGADDSYTYLKTFEASGTTQFLNLIALFKDDTSDLEGCAICGKYYYDYDENAETHPYLEAQTSKKSEVLTAKITHQIKSYLTGDGQTIGQAIARAQTGWATVKAAAMYQGMTEEQAEAYADDYILDIISGQCAAGTAEQILASGQTFFTQTENGDMSMLGPDNNWFSINIPYDLDNDETAEFTVTIRLSPDLTNVPEGESHLGAFIYNGMAVLLDGFRKIPTQQA